MTVKDLVSEIKLSGHFNDALIFEGIQYKVAPEILNKKDVETQIRFEARGQQMKFDTFKHPSV